LTAAAGDIRNTIAEVVFNSVPKEAEISRIEFEGPRVAIYIKKPEVLIDQSHIVSTIASLIKKRIVIRSDPSIRKDEHEVKKLLSALVPEEAEISNIVFDPTVGEIIIEAAKPGLVIGKNGFSLQEIIKATKWRPRVLRSPPLPSKIIANIRHYLHSESKERERILRTVGERIFRKTYLKGDDIRVTALGGFREVGRSAILVQTKKSRILLDCGLNLGGRNSSRIFPQLNSDVFNLELLDAVVISHAHLDHCGFLPFLYKYGYDGPVYCSEPTTSLMTLLQLDYLDVVKNEGRVVPYDQKDVRNTVLHTIPINPGSVTDISPDVRLTIHNAGHILGSTLIHLHIGDGLHNIVYTSDFKYGRTWLLEPAVTNFPRVETLIVESTYGAPNDIMPTRRRAEEKLISVINASLEKNGKVLIPVPAVGRAQEIMLILDGYMKHGLLREAPVYVEGMVNEATAIHTAYPESLAKDVRNLIFHDEVNPFQSENFIKVTDPTVRKDILRSESAIIIATSGMLEGGPSVQYFKEMASNSNNALIFVSYQIEGTLGNRLQKGLSEARILNDQGKVELIRINLRAESVEGFSGHSDRNQIFSYLRKIVPKPERIIVNHGERKKCIGLANSIHKMFRIETYAPALGETIRLK
jgi:KH/beta-lactamase-domain protein